VGSRDQDERIPVVDVVVGVLVLFSIAVAQPLLDLLGRNAEFFIARDATPGEILWFTILLVLVVPMVLAAIPILIGLISKAAGRWAYALAVGALGALFGLQLGRRLGPAAVAFALAAIVGALVGLTLSRSDQVRRFLRYGVVLPVILAALFLVTSETSRLFEGGGATVGAAALRDKVPVVLVVFDELPSMSLMRPDRSLDTDLFPNFGRLARSSTWFRNTTGVNGATARAVPSILDGRFPGRGELPIPADHPGTLFALLGRDYEVTAQEPMMKLCPEDVCGEEAPADDVPMWDGLFSDLRIIGLHLTLPEELTADLPPVNETWGDFAADQEGSARPDRRDTIDFAERFHDRPERFGSFVRSIRPRPRPHFYFMHAILPHTPWTYLPDGRRYPNALPLPGTLPGFSGRVWGSDEWLVVQAYQRHLLQLQFTDKLLGQLLDRLERQGMMEEVLLVVTADHGASFRPDVAARKPTPESATELSFVPMFVKRPGDDRGKVVDAPTQTLDVVPTIIESLGGEAPEGIDGLSAFGQIPRDRERLIGIQGAGVDVHAEEFDSILQELHQFFAPAGRKDLYAIGPGTSESLIGRDAQGLAGGSSQGSFTLDQEAAYDDLNPEAEIFPSLVGGELSGIEPQTVLAVAINGRVTAVTRSYERDDSIRFYAMVPPTAFRPGSNSIEVYVVEGERLAPLAG
jgi:hypothetical protein